MNDENKYLKYKQKYVQLKYILNGGKSSHKKQKISKNSVGQIHRINLDDLDNCKDVVHFDYIKMFEFYLKQYMEKKEFKKEYKTVLDSNMTMHELYSFFDNIYNKNPENKTPVEKMHRVWGSVYGLFKIEQVTNASSNMGQTYNTPYTARIETRSIIEKYISNSTELTILDANSNIGMDSLYFCSYFNKVICCEYIKEVACALAHNIKNLTKRNANVYQGSCLDLLENDSITKEINVIYFDPPWGGEEWNKIEMLQLGKTYMNDVINFCFTRYNIPKLEVIFLKIPKHTGKYSYLNNQIAKKFRRSIPKDVKLIEEEIKYSKDNGSSKDNEFTYYLYTFVKPKKN
jgi:16S rRNA G966 N2-methylase RsmD